MTPRQLQICRRWHHDIDRYKPTDQVPIAAAELRAILSALWAGENELLRRDQIRTRRLIRRAERNLTIFGPDDGDRPLLAEELAASAGPRVPAGGVLSATQAHAALRAPM